MNFIISSNILLKGLQNVSGLLSSNSLVPIIENFLFSTDGSKLLVTATDNETRAIVELSPEKISGMGAVAIPPRVLLETLKTFPNIPITINVNEETFAVEISAGEGVYRLAGYNPENYPSVAAIENAKSISMSSIVLQNAVSSTIFACGNDEIRPQLMGVFFEITPDYTNFVATDAHKLVRFRRNDIKSDEAHSFIVHKKPLNLLRNLLNGFDCSVSVEFNNTNVSFRFENYQVVCRLLDGKYPAYEGVISKDNNYKLVINRNSLISTLKRVAIFANQASHQVRFDVKGQELNISAEDIDYSNEAKERLNCIYDGADIEIGFNSKFFLETLQTLVCENITMTLSSPTRAALLIPEETNSAEEDVLMLIMPIMLNA
ncbi:Beta sliding clamp [anaerobic digester metagenome]